MRDAYHESLAALTGQLEAMATEVGVMMRRATAALASADITLAEQVISDDAVIDRMFSDIEQSALDLFARQQPVAGDLRVLLTGLRIDAEIERMGDLARHIAKVARLRYPQSAVPEEARPIVERMGEVAIAIAGRMGDVLRTRDVELAKQLEQDDDEMDRLHRQLFELFLGGEAWSNRVECVVDVTLLGRYYERFCDHAVSVARRIVFQATGEREGSLFRVPSPPHAS